MRRFICVLLIATGVFAIYVALLGINMFCASVFVIVLALVLAMFLTNEPFSMPDPGENLFDKEMNDYQEDQLY